MKKTLTTLTIAAAIAGGALSGAAPANAEYLGGVDIQGWCANTQQAMLADTTTVTHGGGAYSWRCVYKYDTGLPGATGKTSEMGVDMTDACSDQYGYGAWAKTDNGSDPNSWRCYN